MTNQEHKILKFYYLALRLCVTFAVPVLVVLLSLRLVMTPAFLYAEYNRPGFPADDYGFTQKERLRFALDVTGYLLSEDGSVDLSQIELSGGSRLFVEQELDHLRELKTLIRSAYFFAIIIALAALCSAGLLWRRRQTRAKLYQALLKGNLLTIILTISVFALAAICWNLFFTELHKLLFRGTWKFHYSYALIRLFPDQFWFDTTLVFISLTLFSSITMSLIVRQWHKREETILLRTDVGQSESLPVNPSGPTIF